MTTRPPAHPPMRSFVLRSHRLGFSTWSPADLGLARELWGDARVTRFFGGPFSEAAIEARLEAEIATQSTLGYQYWPLFQLADESFVGCCGLRPVPERNGVLELGIHLRPGFWGRGLATEAARVVIAHAFGTLGATALFAGHHPANADSRRVVQRLGFRYLGDELYPPTGLNHPSYLLTDDRIQGSQRQRPANDGTVYRAATAVDVPEMARCRLSDPVAGPADARMGAYLEGLHHPQKALAPRVAFVALVRNTTVGYIAGHLTTRFDCQGEVQYLYVSPAWRRVGVASALLALLAQWFVQQHALRVCVNVDSDSPAARPFYLGMGATDLRPHWMVWDDIRGGPSV